VHVLEGNQGVAELQLPVRNVNRSVGGRVAGAIARLHGDDGFKGQLRLSFSGSAGQSFGVWNLPGMHLKVEGECNDYVGKGMHGGTIAAYPPAGSTFTAADNVIAGNTCLYGATGGEVYLSGRVGERFGVRNAGCQTVVEGAGDHLGEYMTGGVIVALGQVGRNIGAGMSGGLMYLYDPERKGLQMNSDNEKNVFDLKSPAGQAQLKKLVENHQALTGSTLAADLLAKWPEALEHFWQVAPPSEQQTELVAGSPEEAVSQAVRPPVAA